MISVYTIHAVIYTTLVFTGVYGFSSCDILRQQKVYHREHLFATINDDDNNSGAGAWRAKAKEFQDNPEGFTDSDKKLNIAFVVSVVSFCMCVQ